MAEGAGSWKYSGLRNEYFRIFQIELDVADTWIVDGFEGYWNTFTECHTGGKIRNRYIVRASMDELDFLNAAVINSSKAFIFSGRR